jgi:hypothetical protein
MVSMNCINGGKNYGLAMIKLEKNKNSLCH